MLALESKLAKRKFYFPFILDILNRGFKPMVYNHETGGRIDTYFILGDLPNGRKVIYINDAVSIVVGHSPLGYPIYDKCGSYRYYSDIEMLNGCTERDLVACVKSLISRYYGDFKVVA